MLGHPVSLAGFGLGHALKGVLCNTIYVSGVINNHNQVHEKERKTRPRATHKHAKKKQRNSRNQPSLSCTRAMIQRKRTINIKCTRKYYLSCTAACSQPVSSLNSSASKRSCQKQTTKNERMSKNKRKTDGMKSGPPAVCSSVPVHRKKRSAPLILRTRTLHSEMSRMRKPAERVTGMRERTRTKAPTPRNFSAGSPYHAHASGHKS